MTVIPFDPDRVAATLSIRGQKWADAESAFRALEDASKSVLSQCMIGAGDVSAAKAEMIARTSPLYAEHLAALDKARHEANFRRVRYDTYRVWIELRRSENATRRAEMGLR